MISLCHWTVGAILVVLCEAQLHENDWPQFGRTPTFESFNDVGNDGQHPEWTFNAGDRVVASAAVAAGRVYIGSDNGKMYCFNQTTGQVLWAYTAGSAVRSSPAVFKDLSVAFGSYDSYIYRVDASGNMMWRFQTGNQIYGPATITANNTVLIGSQDGYLYHLTADGQLLWKFQAASAMNSGPAIGSKWQDRTVVRSYDGYVYCVALATGQLIWKYKTLGGGGSSAVITGNDVYIGSWDMFLYKFDIQTGNVIWRFFAKGEIESHPAYRNGVVFLSAEESKTTYALNATTGQKIWEYSTTEEFNGSPSLSRELVFVGANDHYMHALDQATGQLKFKFETCANVFASAAIADNGMIYFACNTATLDADEDGDNLGVVYAVNPAKHLN